MTSKQKANVAELAVAADLARRGFTVAIPFGEYGDWDLLVDRGMKPMWAPRFERVQVKYVKSDSKYIKVPGRTHSVLAGRVSKTTHYTQDSVEWLAAYDVTTDKCYYVPGSWLTQSQYMLRLEPPKNNQWSGIRWAKDYLDMIEPRPDQLLVT